MPKSTKKPLPSSPPTFITHLAAAFPALKFKPAPRFRFHPPHTIFYQPNADYFELQTLHELGHVLIEQNFYTTDIERLKIERAAWDKARTLCQDFGVKYDPNFVEYSLDSYRDWLHSRAKCPRCSLTRYQTPDSVYHCPNCDNQ